MLVRSASCLGASSDRLSSYTRTGLRERERGEGFASSSVPEPDMFTLCMSRGPPPLQDSSQKYNVGKKKQIKCGYLLRYKRGFLCKGWCEEWVVLFEDSTLAWYADKSLNRLRGCVRISEAPELLAVGEWTRQVPRKPRFPRACHVGQLLAVGCKMVRDVHWLMGQTSAEINDWMTAISNTLPPPPNVLFDEKRLTRVSMANGRANPVPNGCATIIPNGKCPTVKQNGSAKMPASACSCDYVKPKGKKAGKFENDHTILAGKYMLRSFYLNLNLFNGKWSAKSNFPNANIHISCYPS
ncbi:unnamed protein product [Ceutorhynchus assimilis]|uniref:PH domain-containing protein n=1 Tax=Ceutorhynchus assimilis TaxID=467358 RepID=A0A9N9QFA8_9CUCU|nr:unnamed protein product [Ceutorhynchus assimilis]